MLTNLLLSLRCRRASLLLFGRRSATYLLLLSGASCFSMLRDPARRFYVLHVNENQAPQGVNTQPTNDTLVRVRDLDCESAYDKFQMVVRRSPFELVYRNKDVWAVKPGRMVSDLIARTLQQRAMFAGVTRELGERRPDWLVSGDLNVIEIEQMTNTWQAHVALSLQISNVDTGDIVWSAHYEEREPCEGHDYAVAAEATSRALGRSIERALVSLAEHPLMQPSPKVGPSRTPTTPKDLAPNALPSNGK